MIQIKDHTFPIFFNVSNDILMSNLSSIELCSFNSHCFLSIIVPLSIPPGLSSYAYKCSCSLQWGLTLQHSFVSPRLPRAPDNHDSYHPYWCYWYFIMIRDKMTNIIWKCAFFCVCTYMYLYRTCICIVHVFVSYMYLCFYCDNYQDDKVYMAELAGVDRHAPPCFVYLFEPSKCHLTMIQTQIQKQV